ncbi:hypothetical protein GCM10025868_03880 [Angustibacter aerolatus]|uniref:Uncharacterized protein n=1 Tax=Angustibacter aerolatus TaxID=1162965 RepID=A0ABQ6JAD9_9ACTN|nr:hypothetical protein GCM10025868_03880 [Angustibacter aerolatus]
MSGGKIFGSLAMADDSEVPPSTSARIEARASRSGLFSVWSARIVSARSSDRPELIIVANWRAMTARSLSFTGFPRVGRVISLFMPEFVLVMLTGA